MRNFFVTGLARSRTAWLANFLDAGPIECLHELTRQSESLDHMMSICDVRMLGTVDSGLFLAPEVFARFKDRPWVVIERDQAEVEASFGALLGKEWFDPVRLARVNALTLAFCEAVKKHPGTLVIPYEDLDTAEAGKAIWTHVTSGMYPFPRERWERLQPMRIDLHVPKYLETVPEWLVERVGALTL